MSTRIKSVVYILADINEDAPAKTAPTPGSLVPPTFYDTVADTVVWITPFGAVEVPADRWHSGEFTRLAMTAGWSSRTNSTIPEWVTVDLFHSPFALVTPDWAVIGQLWTEE